MTRHASSSRHHTNQSALPADRDEYFALQPLTKPAHRVTKVAGVAIETAAKRYFRGRLIEIGCGTKAKAALVDQYVDEHLGLDHLESPHGPFSVDLLGTAYAIPVLEGSFDCVLSTSVIEHLEHPLAALRESCRVLKPGGYALYTAPLFWHLHEEPRDFFRYTRHGLRYLFEEAGFEITELQPLAGFLTTAFAQTGYYLQRFRRGPLIPIVNATVALMNILAMLDRGVFRDERFTWSYLVVARRPLEVGS